MRETYLDGLRGWAALVVVLCHAGEIFWPAWRPGFYLLATDGSFSVFIFFVLSGYVLSVGFFRTSERRAVVDLALRRYPRLTVPIFAASCLAMGLMALGLMRNIPASKVTGSEGWLPIVYAFTPTVADVLHFSFWRVYVDGSPASSYDAPLWTMPVEMQGSILVFAALLVMGRGAVLRGAIHVALLAVTGWLASPFVAMAAGAAIANFTQLDMHRKLAVSNAAPLVSWALSIGAIVFAAVRPNDFGPVWLTLCSAGLLYGVLLNKGFQRALSSPVSQWLGRVSFSLYLLHIPVLCSFTSWAYLALGGGERPSTTGIAVLLIATVALCLVAAALFHPMERLGITMGRRLSQAVLRVASSARSRGVVR
ncbi:peptidoglycan/LPS O-acetylase OafA/YrhL [Variovorax boronicumulans]|uniref:Peptidoglycan/LPS O-acetylase OafA/YrhL n=1 Tax=Variovorax boronicumulans TaxID=436515 RepID=A0AAW8D6Z3_9BURK|nr:acyltransferase [Variovorax boronicumulans]MDP9895797.1 peptidoglycan/LPS O-acetylase OafA/YrhL [Variovorax boronicumulans]MDQ0055837.1 peptidoglycan/LPS O-acetylase OafA/YrhL [Variovorax boronicumulans]